MKNLKMKLSVIVMLFAFAVLLVPTTGKVSAASKSCGSTFTVGNLCYQVTGNSTCTVTGVSNQGKKATSCNVPSTVSCNGTKYKVTEIADKAFCNNKSLKSVKVSNNVKCIGSKAFYGCSNLKNVSLGKCVNTVESKAFSNCTSLNNIKCTTVAKTLGSNCFGNATCKIVK